MNDQHNYGYTADRKFVEACKGYNLANVLGAMVDSRAFAQKVGREYELSQELQSKSGKSTQGFMVPWAVLSRGLTVGSATGGGHTVATELLANSFIDVLRPVSIAANLGATYLNGLVGNVAIPRATAGATSYWVAENGAPTESQQAFDQITMQPKTLGASTTISRKLLLQSAISISDFIVTDLRNTIGQKLDEAIFTGSGTGNEPMGLLNNSTIQTMSLGTNGAALTWGNLVDMETQVATANADLDSAQMAYVLTKKLRGKLGTTSKVAGENGFIWEHAQNPVLPGEGVVNGNRAIATNLLPSNLTKGTSSGVCSAAIYANWRDLVIGQWGAGIDLVVDPYTLGTTGAVKITAMTDVDFAIRHAESFIKVKDALTA